jgi:hypothetical protein
MPRNNKSNDVEPRKRRPRFDDEYEDERPPRQKNGKRGWPAYHKGHDETGNRRKHWR